MSVLKVWPIRIARLSNICQAGDCLDDFGSDFSGIFKYGKTIG